MSLRIDLEIDKGQTFRRGFLFSRDGVPIDLTGYTVRVQARVAKTLGATLVLDLSTENTDDPAPLVFDEDIVGRVNMILSRDQTRELPEGKFPWELELTTPDDESDILCGGVLKVILGVIQ